MPGLGYRRTLALRLWSGFWLLVFGFCNQASAIPLAEYCPQYFFGHRLVCPYFFA